jgi:phytoene synthase
LVDRGVSIDTLAPLEGRGQGEGSLPSKVAAPLGRTWTVDEAFAFCSALTRAHYENFPVGSSLIPKDLRPAVHCLYAFMRTADDFSDEDRQAGDETERMAWLESWEAMLSECEQGIAAHPIFVALRSTLERHRLPAQWLHDLLHAFKMDVTVRRYATYADLLTYCRYSANPVGRLILTLFGYRDEALYRLSDAICTGLQLANHWQDVAVDLKKDRIYLPKEDMEKCGLRDGDFSSREEFKKLMAFEVTRARALFDEGRSLPEKVTGRLRWELRFTWHGGVRILDKIEQAHFDVLNRRPVVTKADWLGIAFRALF